MYYTCVRMYIYIYICIYTYNVCMVTLPLCVGLIRSVFTSSIRKDGDGPRHWKLSTSQGRLQVRVAIATLGSDPLPLKLYKRDRR